MSKLITHIKRLALALCLATPIVSWAAEPVAVWDGNFSSSELTKFTGYELVDWNETHGENNSSVTIDRANHGLMFNAESAMPGMTILVRYSNLTAGSSKKVLFTSCVASNHSGYRTGVRLGTDGKICGMWLSADNGTASGSVPESGVMAFTYSTAGTYLYAAEKGTEALKQVWGSSGLKSSQDTAIYGGSAGGFCDGSSISGFSAASGMTIEAIAVFNSVVSLAEMQEYLWPTEAAVAVSRTIAADATVNWSDAAWTVGETADQAFTPSADALYDVTVTVGGDCTIVMPETIGAFNRRRIKFALDSGAQSATVTLKYAGTLPEAGSSAVLNPFGDACIVAGAGVTLSPEYNGDTAGYVVSVSDLTVTIIKGSNYEGTLTANTNWSDIKPEGWANAIAGDQPSITVNYEGTEPITLTFDEAVQAGSLTLTGNIVVEATAAATFGTVTAGAGSVVEMANMTITTQAGAGTYRYRSNYPGTVPNQSLTYEYVGGADSESAGAVTLSGMRGTVKTTGFMNISGYYPLNTASHLDVVSGTTTLTAGGQGICGYITIRKGATLVNTATDSLAYSSYNSELNIYGTLDMGTSRWTVWSGATFNFRGGEMIGVGEGNNGALDFMGTCNVNAYADSTLSGNVKFRNALSNVTVEDGVTLTISGETKQGYDGGGITKKGAGTLKFTSDPYVPGGIVVEAGTLAFDTESDVDPVVTYTAAVLKDANMDYATASNWKGRIVISAVEAGTTATQVALNKTGNENSYLTLNGVSGNAWCANDDYTVQPAITLAGDVNFENGSSGKTVTFRKIAAGSGNLSLKRWSSCTGITYGFTTLDADNYTGTIQLDGSVLTFNVGDILKANAQPGDKVLPLTVANSATVNLSGATVNGEAADLELKEDGIYIAVPVVNVTVTVPAVPNTTVVVTADGEPVTGDNGSYVVPEGSEVVATYTAVDGYEMTGTASYTIDSATEGAEVTPSITTKQYVAYVVFQVEQGESFVDVTNYYTSVEAAIGAAKALKKTIVLIAQPDAEDTYEIAVGETINVKKGEFTFDGIIFPTGPQYNNTTTVIAGVTQYKCTVNTATVQYPGQEPVGVSGQLIQILGGLYSGYVPAYAGTVVTVLDGSDATVGDALPDVFTYNSEAHTYTLKTMVASYNNGYTTTYYPTLAYAVANVPTGGTIVLLANVTITEGIEITDSVSVTLDMDGKTITYSPTYEKKDYISLFNVAAGSTLTIDGNGEIVGPENGAAYDGKVIISVSGTLNYLNGTLTATGSGSDGMYGVYVLDGGTATFGVEKSTTGPNITSHFAAIGTNNTTAPATITVYSGTYTANANPANKEWWSYFCAPVYAAANGWYTLAGGTFNGYYGLSTRYANTTQTITLTGATLNATSGLQLFIDTKTGTGTGMPMRSITSVSNGVTIPETWKWVSDTVSGNFRLEDNSGIDPSGYDSKQEVKVTEEDVEAAGGAEAAAIAKASVKVPDTVIGEGKTPAEVVDAATYKTYFNFTVTDKGNGVYEVAFAEQSLKQDVVLPETVEVDEETINRSEKLLEAVLGSEDDKATIPSVPGIYYWMQASNGLDFKETSSGTTYGDRVLAEGTTVTLPKPEILPSGNAVFFRVRAGVIPNN